MEDTNFIELLNISKNKSAKEKLIQAGYDTFDKLKDKEGGLTKELLREYGFNEYEVNKIWNRTHPESQDIMETFVPFKRRKLESNDNAIKLYNFLGSLDPNKLSVNTIINLPENCRWFNNSSFPMLIRKSYAQIFEKCENLRQQNTMGIVVSGNPGIGKSCFLNYCVLKYVFELKKTVFLQIVSLDRCLFLSPTGITMTRLDVAEISKADIYLFDAGRPRKQPLVATCFTIVSSSPNQDNYSGWYKEIQSKTKFYMPCWDLVELVLIDKYYNLDTENLSERFYYYDGIPRYIFDNNQQQIREQQETALKLCNASTIIRCMGDQFTYDNDLISHKIIKIVVNEINYTERTFELASPYVSEIFPKILMESSENQAIELVKRTLKDFPQAASLRGSLFEPLGHRLISLGGKFQTSAGMFELPPLKRVDFEKTFDEVTLDDLQKNCYIVPKHKNFALVDAFYLMSKTTLITFQFTVSDSHSFNEAKAEQLITNLQLELLRIYYVLPTDKYMIFKVPEFKNIDGTLEIEKLCLEIPE